MSETEIFYGLQKNWMTEHAQKKEYKNISDHWYDENNANSWRLKRMYETIAPVADFYNNSTWLSIGDGRCGLDSFTLKNLFGIDVFPTDISEEALAEGKAMGLIQDYQVENAESLSFPDNSYDIVYCKESCHHFPRPILALYEMIRVSRKAVILTEPNDDITIQRSGFDEKKYIMSAVKLLLAKLFKKEYLPYFPEIHDTIHLFEKSGNYLYTLSIRELTKIVHGLDLAGMAWLGFNDLYIEGCASEPASEDSKIFNQIRTHIKSRDELCRLYPNLYSYGVVTCVIFKDLIKAELKCNMEDCGYRFVPKKENPILKNTKI